MSLVLAQRAMGNRGLQSVIAPSGLRGVNTSIDITNWLDEGAIEYLAGHRFVLTSGFEEITAEALPKATGTPLDRKTSFVVLDASTIYNGESANWPQFGPWINLVPGFAHDDVRDSEPAARATDDEVSKRRRTFNFIYNMTRGALPSTVAPELEKQQQVLEQKYEQRQAQEKR